MKIKTISRTISGNNFDNLSCTAELEEGDKLADCAKSLDSQLREALSEISEHREEVQSFRQEKNEAVSILEMALEHAKNNQIPF